MKITTTRGNLPIRKSNVGGGGGGGTFPGVLLRLLCWMTMTMTMMMMMMMESVEGFSFVTPITSNVQRQEQQQQQQHRRQLSPFYEMKTASSLSSSSSSLKLAYISPEEEEKMASTTTATATKSKSLHPKIGDLVRYYDLDGGYDKGEELVGKITFISKTSSGWLVELTELENVGDGYFAEYSSSKRMSKKTDRNVQTISPLSAAFVRSEQAFKVPIDSTTGRPKVRQERYDLDDYQGPQAVPIDKTIVEQDGLVYNALKVKLLKNAALAGLIGTVLANILKGPEDALIYFAGALASVGYLFFLSIKTDTLASPDRKLGNNIANLRFLMPVLVIVGVALYNKSLGDDANPLLDPNNPLDTVTPEQFAAAVIGFLTYRIPLFLGQIQEALKDLNGGSGDAVLPGSAGMAMKLASSSSSSSSTTSLITSKQDLIPVLLVSGPQATGRPELVQRLLKLDNRFVSPKMIDRLQDGVTYERLQSRDELLFDNGRFGLTTDAILRAASNAAAAELSAAATAAANDNNNEKDETLLQQQQQKAVVVDANVDVVKKIVQKLPGSARIIGVWIGLNSVQEFEKRINQDIDSGKMTIPEDETRESLVRAKIKEIIKEIEYGLSSGIFEFTILNDDNDNDDGTDNNDPERSLKELKQAAEYCFK